MDLQRAVSEKFLQISGGTQEAGVIQRALLLLCLPILLLGLVAIPLGFFLGPYQWLCFGVAIGLTVPAGLVTLLTTSWLNNSSQFGNVVALFVGTFVRLVTGFGGGVILFLVSGRTFRVDPVSFWLWLLVAYLVALTIEIVLLVRK